MVCVIGPSGSGKSTLLRCVNLLEEPTAGTVFVEGAEITDPDVDIDQVRRRIGMVFQQFNLFPHLTVLDNLTIAQRRVKGAARTRPVGSPGRTWRRSGWPTERSAYPAQLSGGQQQRVAIARALSMDPDMMLFDEPTSALDPELVGDVLEVMRRPRSRGHDHDGRHPRDGLRPRGRATAWSSWTAASSSRRATPAEVLGDPQHERTQSFLSKVL